mgnify:CR=1 FL=1
MSELTITSSAGMLQLPAIEQMGQRYGMTAQAFAFTFRAVAMPQPHSEAEFVSCCLVAREHGLNPLTKEIYFMRTKGSGIQPIVSVDGWMKKCNEHPQFDGMEFEEERGGDGAPIAMTCIIYRKDRKHPVKVTEHLDECKGAGGAVWKTSPRRMLRHRALTQAARYAFGFAGVMDRDEFEQWQAMKDITPKRERAPAAITTSDDIPEIPEETASQEIPEVTAEADAPLADGKGVLEKLREALEGQDDEVIRLEIWEGMSDLIGRLDEADARTAEKIFEGRA